MTTKQPLWDIKIAGHGDAIFIPGKRDPAEFVAQCRDHDDGYDVLESDVAYCYARWIPVWEDGEFQGHYLDYPTPGPKRGAFLITLAERYTELGYSE